MSIGNNKGEGNKGRNFPYQHNVLKGLQGVVDNTGGLIGVLNAILNATVAHQDMEILLVRDDGNDQVLQQIREYDETTQTWSTTYVDVTGAPYGPFVGSPVYLDPSAVLNLILTELLDQGLSLDAIATNTGLSATEATLLLTNALLTTIDADTSNLDVTLSSRWNTLGQKLTAESAPVVLSTQQEGILQGTFDNIKASTWDTTVGNTKTFTYYAGAGPGHPAATTTEVQTIVYSDGGGVVFTQTFTYDASNNVLTIVVS